MSRICRPVLSGRLMDLIITFAGVFKQSAMAKPNRISIILATYNAGKYLETAIQSIIGQKYPDLELIIIDGKSTDNTMDIVSRYGQYLSIWKSEPDNGIYDAWNKGIGLATGEWIMFLGSDDKLLPDSLISYSDFIDSLKEEVDFISSKMLYTDKKMKPYRTMGWRWEWPRFRLEMIVAHTGSLHSRKLFDKYGKYNTDYKIVGDYEFLLRPGKDLKTAFLDKITVMYREGGASDSYAAIFEAFKASRSTGKSPLYQSFMYSFFVCIKYTVRKTLHRANINVHLRN
jgi:glycosyltransferase involved in cell wall biosynthesis